jgi:hypothetical protein
MPAPTSTRPARGPWLTWAVYLLFLAATLAVPFACRWVSRPEGLPPSRRHNGQSEVFLRNPHAWDGEWLPLGEATSSPLLWLVHQGCLPAPWPTSMRMGRPSSRTMRRVTIIEKICTGTRIKVH